MKIKGNKASKKRINIEGMPCRIAGRSLSMSIVVPIHGSIAVQNGYRSVVWKYRDISVRKHGKRAVNR